MNLKKIAGMCKRAGIFHITGPIVDESGTQDQWVMLGGAAYHIGQMGLTAYTLARLAGIKDGQTDEYLLRDERMEETPDWMRDFPKQTPDADTERAIITLGYDGRQILFYRLPDGGVLPVNEEYLAPIDSEREFAVRMVAGVPALAIKEGMYIAAMIAKYDAFGEKDGIKLPELRAALSREKDIWR